MENKSNNSSQGNQSAAKSGKDEDVDNEANDDEFLKAMDVVKQLNEMHERDGWQVTLNEMIRADNFFRALHTFFCPTTCIEIWGEKDWKFYWDRLAKYRSSTGYDYLAFFRSLDVVNQTKLIQWHNNLMRKIHNKKQL